jgi:hypothetical protein
MKTIISILLAVITSGTLLAQDIHTQEVKSEVNSALVYLDGAEVSRDVKVDLKAGKNEIIFPGISPTMNSKTMRVKSPDNITILSLSSNSDYLYKKEYEPRAKSINDSLKLIQSQLRKIADQQDALWIEKRVLLKNRDFKSKQKGISIEELKVAAEFFRTKVHEINTKISELNKQKVLHQAEQNKLQNQLYELNIKGSYYRNNITLLLEAEKEMTAELTLKYVVTEAGWVPMYDIIAEDISESIKIVYRAKVYNKTDIDWKNINVKLSTADPLLSASKPEIDPWYLNYSYGSYNYNAYNYDYEQSYDQRQSMIQQQDITRGAKGKDLFEDEYLWDFGGDYGVESDSISFDFKSIDLLSTSNELHSGTYQVTVTDANGAQVNSGKMISMSDMNAEFEIKKEYTINADGKPYYLDVKDFNLPTTYKHYAVPKKESSAYLISKITGWEEANMVSGFANIYLDDTYIGKSFINTGELSDTLEISLGKDNQILVERKQLKEFTKKQLIGTSKKEFYAYEIKVKNNRKSPVEITIIDQIPVSEDNEIDVEKLDITSGADINELNGEVKWDHIVNANEVKTMKLSYSIKYPKNKPIKTQKGAYKAVRFL